MDWEELHLVQMLARHDSLSAAARALGTTQPTLSRRLDAFEQKAQQKLFERQSTGLVPTAACLSILSALEQMEAAALSVERRLAAQDDALKGTVTVTSLDWLGDYLLAPMLTRFAATHPGVTIHLLNDGRRFNLSRRDADIAFRFGGFDQNDTVERKVADIRYGLFASQAYLDRFGHPNATGRGHAIVELAEMPVRVSLSTWLKDRLPEARIMLRANSIRSQLSAVETGAALATLPCYLAADRDGLVPIDLGVAPPLLSLKLGVHQETRNLPRVRKLIDFAAAEFAGLRPKLNPPN
ncbi:LysR family transcriptional regulator (plasmid) [Ensifer adhaerens]|uniref:LysR family transcriptional regulator n=1 Tax=Ensifer adhaerens TaxID=106592 RepID=UPI0023A9F5F7|nr:LysR family transcriptional regulator [Ensifer adhaerens]WDZ79635.1 LysR family transcriptional regulator [Ensifer adhaerens]